MGSGLTNPATDNEGFCADFKKTVDFIWKDFGAHSTLQPRIIVPTSPFCGDLPQPQQDHCTVSNIVGFTNIVSDFNADNCKCPNSDPSLCPDSCNIEALRNDIVQGLLRSVPWTPRGDPAMCGGCPSIDPNVCNLPACVNPSTPSPNATLYDRNKFLHFWSDPTSVYNLDPYVFFVHNSKSVNGPGAYAFSIDDFYGNFSGQGSTLIVDVGGTGRLPNPEPFDPFKQYVAGIGEGWDHADVCGRTFGRPPAAKGKGPLAGPISFWSNGQPQAECVIKLFPHPSDHEYVAYKLTQVGYQVTDNQTGLMQPVQGLGGTFANRTFPNQQPPPIPPDPYCMANSVNISPAVLMQGGLCNGNLSSAGADRITWESRTARA
jgi:hypothetical protein